MSYDFSTLVSGIQGVSTLNKFDVLMAYSEDQVNTFLKAAAASSKVFTVVPTFDTPEANLGSLKYHYTCNFTLGAPVMQFSDTQLLMTVPLSGTYTLVLGGTAQAPTPVPTGTTALITTNLGSVSGTVSDGSFTADASQTVTPANTLKLVPPSTSSTTAALSVTIDMMGATVTISSSGSAASDLLNMQLALQAYIQKNSSPIYLNTVTSQYKDTTNDLLIPKVFYFSVQNKTLCIWLGVNGGANTYTNTTTGFTATFMVNGTAASPVPTSSSACIYFSKQLMQSTFFIPALTTAGFTSVTPQTGAGISFTAHMPSSTLGTAAYTHTDQGDMYSETYHVDAVQFNPSSNLTTITLGSGVVASSPAPLSLSWASGTIKCHWYDDTDFQNGPGTVSPNPSGDVDFTFSLSATGQWSGLSTTANPNLLGMTMSLPATFASTYTNESKPWFDRAMGDGAPVPGDYTSLSVPVPASLNITFETIDYFLLTNVLMPGKTMFIADSPVGGLATPSDTVLTGKIATAPS